MSKLSKQTVDAIYSIRARHRRVPQRRLAEAICHGFVNLTPEIRALLASGVEFNITDVTDLRTIRAGGRWPSEATIYNRIRAYDGSLDLATGATFPGMIPVF